MTTKDLLNAVTAAAKESARRSADATVSQLEAAGALTGATTADVEPVVQALTMHRWFDLAAVSVHSR